MEEKNGKILKGNTQLWKTSIPELLAELGGDNPFRKKVKSLRDRVKPWPVPNGDIPVLWSAEALSKLLLLFLHGFEGDLVLENLSFLTQVSLPLQLPFSIMDQPDLKNMPYDNEGSPRRSLVLFDEGKPKALACNKQIAKQLSVSSTGHCRRESFQNSPTVGFWNLTLHTEGVEGPLIKKLDKGIVAEDIEILSFNPTTADIRIRIEGAYLIHLGECGEAIQPLEIQGNLITLLQSLTAFSEKQEKKALPVTKRSQRFFTEISSPSAISHPIPIVGKVPQSYYW